MKFSEFFRVLRGRSHPAFARYLLGQVEVAYEAAETAMRIVTPGEHVQDARDVISEIEHKGDEYRRLLVTRLSGSLITPIDREDLFRLSRCIDDIADNIRDFVREWDLMGAESSTRYRDILKAVVNALAELRHAVEALDGEVTFLSSRSMNARKSSNAIRYAYQDAVSELLSEETVSMKILRRRELLRRLDVLANRVDDAINALADAAVKRTLL